MLNSPGGPVSAARDYVMQRSTDSGSLYMGTPAGKKNNTVLTGYTAIIDILLRKGVTNSNVILERLQDNLFIGMIHAFQRLGVPATVLTDNMNRYMRSSSIVSLCFLQVLPGLSTGL